MSPPHVPIATYKRNLKKAEVLYYFSKGYSAKEIARKLNAPYSTVRKQVYRFKKQHYITKKNTLTSKARDMVERYVVQCQDVPPDNVPETVRLHDLVIRCKVEDPNWESKREQIAHMKLKGYKSWAINNGFQQSFHYDFNTTIRTTSKSVLIKLPDVYAATPQKAKQEALEIFFKVRQRVEQLLKVRLMKRARLDLCVTSNQHLAFIYDELAKFFLKEKITLRIYDQRGELLWVVDDSLGLAELEAVHKAKAEDIGGHYTAFLHDLSKGNHLPLSEVTIKLEKAANDVNRLLQSQEQQAQIIQQLTEAITVHFSQVDGVGKWA